MVKLENTHTISQSQKENPTSPSNTLGITGNLQLPSVEGTTILHSNNKAEGKP